MRSAHRLAHIADGHRVLEHFVGKGTRPLKAVGARPLPEHNSVGPRNSPAR